MNFSENWYTSSHWHKNNTGKVSWTSEAWFRRYERVLNRHTHRQTANASLLSHSHRQKLFVGDKKSQKVKRGPTDWPTNRQSWGYSREARDYKNECRFRCLLSRCSFKCRVCGRKHCCRLSLHQLPCESCCSYLPSAYNIKAMIKCPLFDCRSRGPMRWRSDRTSLLYRALKRCMSSGRFLMQIE